MIDQTKAAEAVKSVMDSRPEEDVRVCRRAEPGQTVLHQGDVYLHAVDAGHPRGKETGQRQVAVGSTVGARHVATGPVKVYEGKQLPDYMTPALDVPVEAYLGPVTLGLEAGYSDLLAAEAYVLGSGRVYVTDDASLELRVGALAPDDTDPLIVVSAAGELLLLPEIALFSRVESANADDVDFEETSVVFGAKIYFSGESGATLKGYDRGFFQRSCLGMNFLLRTC